MKLYVANCCDRHIDPVIRVFSTPEKAIEFASDFAKENARKEEDIDVVEEDGCLLSLCWSNEGDFCTVKEVELDSE